MKNTNETIKIVFMGTPDFAVPSLEALLDDERFDVLAVVTQPDKKVGRKQILTPPPVKKTALENNIHVLQPNKINEIKNDLVELKPDLAVVVAFGQIIPQDVLDIPKYGFINVHASLLPHCRGAACIQAPILLGDKETGVTIMKMNVGLDTGPILKQNKIVLGKNETAETLHNKLSSLGAETLPECLVEFIEGQIREKEQDEKRATYFKVLKKEDGHIDWTKTAEEIERMTRALNPWPGSFAKLDNKNLKILEVAEIIDINNYKAGEIFEHNDDLAIQAGKGAIVLKKIQLEGKKPTMAKDFLRGNKDVIGKILE